jgi:hypothetical protein
MTTDYDRRSKMSREKLLYSFENKDSVKGGG